MLEGIPIKTGVEHRPAAPPPTQENDAAQHTGDPGVLSTGSVPRGLGPPATEARARLGTHEEKQARDSSQSGSNADLRNGTEADGGWTVDLPGSRADQLAIRLDRETGKAIFELRDRESGQVIRQIPPEEMQRLSRTLPGLLDGLLIDDMV